MDAFGFPAMATEVQKMEPPRSRLPPLSATPMASTVPAPTAASASTSVAASTSNAGGDGFPTASDKPRTSSNASTAPSSNGSGGTALEHNGRYCNPVVMSFIRDDWIQQQLQQRQDEYTTYQKTSIVTGTWNVNAKKPLTSVDTAKMVQWLQFQQQSPSGGQLPDIIALGFQEIVDLNAVNVVVNNQSAQRSSQWEDAILAALNTHVSQNQYKLVLSKNLVGILLVVIVHVDHADFIKEVYGATAGVGIMGMMGNKGGAAVRFSFYDSTLCFVCAHLAAHRENVVGRNADYANILSKIDFKDTNDESLANDVRFLGGEPPILNHDFVFWLGDLNYRITDEVTTEEVFQYSEAGKYGPLLAKEQLLQERKRGNVFHEFEEGAIKFPPTYKFQAGTSVYEKRPEKKLRAPAWCDRILWKAKIPEHVVQLHYNAVMALDLSDHKPVHAFFDVQVKHQVVAKKNQVSRDIMMQLDKWENDNMPKVRLLSTERDELSSGVLSFPHLKYGLEQTKSVVIENTGVVVAHFRFVPKLDDVAICKPWLRVTPAFGMIPPKEKMEIRIAARIDEDTAKALSSGEDTLDDTMILRIETGRDYFLLVSGHYDTSCFGSSLDQLVACTDPVRQSKMVLASSTAVTAASSFQVDRHPHYQSEEGDTASSSVSSSTSSGQQAQKVPKELWRMINDLFQHFLNEKNLFVEAGNKQELVVLREALDTGTAFPSHTAYSMAELLLAWLQSLRDSVVPSETLAQALSNGGGNVAQTCRLLLDTLPPVRYNVLIYLVAFLKEVLKHAQANKLTPDKLAYVFSRCLVAQYKPPSALHRGSNTMADLSQSSPPPSSMSSSGSSSSGSNQLFPEERLRQTAREAEIAQWNATQRTEKMEKMLLHWLTTSAL